MPISNRLREPGRRRRPARIVGLTLVIAITAAACAASATDTTAGSDSTTEQPDPAPSAPSAAQVLLPTPGVARSNLDLDAPIEALVAGLNNAGFDLWRTHPIEPNLVFSPASIGHAMLMGRAAADDTTGRAIDIAFGLPPGPSAHEAWNTIDQLIAESAAETEDVTVTIADRIWPDATARPDQAWVDLLSAEHGASIETLDLRTDPEGSRDRINGWISDETHGLIEDLIAKGSINDQTILVLSNALYFEALWDQFFGEDLESDRVFTLLDGITIDTDFMKHQKLRDRHGTGGDFAFGEVAYRGNGFSMLVIVPDEGSFEAVRERVDQGFLNELDEFGTGPFELHMPPWTTSTSLDLVEWLAGIGAAPGSYPAIDPIATLGGAVHGADIAVDLRGTVAAASTVLMYQLSGPPVPEQVLVANRPFLYLIRHRETGLVLFVGQVTNPTA